MKITYRDTMYLMHVAGAFEEDRIPKRYLTDRCTECGVVQTELDNDHHLVMPLTIAEGDRRVFVVVACEGYHVINPRIFDRSNTTWNDWTEDVEVFAYGAPTWDRDAVTFGAEADDNI